MMKKSIFEHEIIKDRINKFPIYKINNLEYTIYPIEIAMSAFALQTEEEIYFELETSKRICDISKKDLIKATTKIKNFLLNHFDYVIEYTESWDRESVKFKIKYFYLEK